MTSAQATAYPSVSVHDVAAALCNLQIPHLAKAGNEPMSAMKLDRLIYFCQAGHLARYGAPLFDEDVAASVMGPSVEELLPYNRSGEVTQWPMGAAGALNTEQAALVEDVYLRFADYTSSQISGESRTSAWSKARARCHESESLPVISCEDMIEAHRGRGGDTAPTIG